MICGHLILVLTPVRRAAWLVESDLPAPLTPNSRSYLNRWASPDSIVPLASQGTQAWDRYAYANNNPIRYNDPTGHDVGCSGYDDYLSCPSALASQYTDWNSSTYGGCFKCHAAVANGQVALANPQLASANNNMQTWQAIGYTPLIAGTAAVGGAAMASTSVSQAGAAGSAVTTAACSDGDCGNEVSNIYRAVGNSELDDILANNAFRPRPGGGSMDSKWFWENSSSAEKFLEMYSDLNHVVKVTVPKSVLDVGYRVQNLDGLGPAVNFIDDSLDQFNAAILAINLFLSSRLSKVKA